MKHAVDTNVLLRMIVDDGSDQCRAASLRLSKHQIYVTCAVLLETEWVLRSQLRLGAMEIVALFKMLAGLENVMFDYVETVSWAIKALEAGFDFADAMHIHNAKDCEYFLTFDKALIRKSTHIVDFLKIEAP